MRFNPIRILIFTNYDDLAELNLEPKCCYCMSRK